MTAKSRNSNSRLSHDDKVGETPAENAVHDMTENGQSETVEDQTVTVVESQVSVDINPLENDAFDKEEEVEEVDDFEADGLSQLGRSADGIPNLLKGCGLTDTCLQQYVHLQSLVLFTQFLGSLRGS
ncbi:uncharacterized protein LOC122963062 isoform X2 [Acropora millepora]|uniref:uncharacterized protein LOC122963062 isoform X2 n=1 Tax=Acropora millepora TaxID=45264 RepID=UPI001CF35341|nr:uncharacterized protein LOC122963062 isoform X2 [Acropora millepora]